MKQSMLISFLIAGIVIVFVVGYAIPTNDKSDIQVSTEKEVVTVEKVIEKEIIPEPDKFYNLEELDSYLRDLKVTNEFHTQRIGHDYYTEYDYAMWLIDRTTSDGYRFHIQYYGNELTMTDIFVAYTFNSGLIVFINPKTLNIEKKIHLNDVIYRK